MKTKTLLIIIAVGLFLHYVFFGNNQPKEKDVIVGTPGNPDEQDIETALKTIEANYGSEIAQGVEKIYRWETAHFTSPLYRESLSAGMNAQNTTFPYGWNSLKGLWASNDLKPTGLTSRPESGGKRLIVFPSVYAGMAAVAEIMKKRTGNLGSWYSLDPQKAAEYEAMLAGIKTVYV